MSKQSSTAMIAVRTSIFAVAVATIGFGVISYKAFWVPEVARGEATLGQLLGYICMMIAIFLFATGATMAVARKLTAHMIAKAERLPRCLVVTSSTRTQIALSNALSEMEVELLFSTAVDTAKREKFATIILESNDATVDEIRGLRKNLRGRKVTPIVVLAGKGAGEVDFIDAGASNVVRKPLRPEEIKCILETTLR